MLAFVYLAYVGWPFISISDGASFFSPWIWTLASDIEVCSTKQVQAGKGINISARTFHLAQGDILKVCSPSPTGIISPKKKIKTVICPYLIICFYLKSDSRRQRQHGPCPGGLHRHVHAGPDSHLHFQSPLAGVLQWPRSHGGRIQIGLLQWVRSSFLSYPLLPGACLGGITYGSLAGSCGLINCKAGVDRVRQTDGWRWRFSGWRMAQSG